MGLGGADLSHIVSPKSGFIPGMAPEPSTSTGVLTRGGGMLPKMTGEGCEEVCMRFGCWGGAPSPTEGLRPIALRAAGGLDQPLAQEWVPIVREGFAVGPH